MGQLTFREALTQALREEMIRDDSVYVIGIAIGTYREGGVFGVTEGLLNEFGDKRVIETPISEGVIVGSSIGAAILGLRPVAEIMDAEFLVTCFHQLVYEAPQMRFFTNGTTKVPLVVRTAFGAPADAAPVQQQSPESWFIHAPGLKVVMPSTPADAKGLLKAAIRDDSPVLFFEHKRLYDMKGEVPEGEFIIPLGKADIKREGKDVTVIATARMVHEALEAAKKLSDKGVELEVIDPRTLLPLDKASILNSVKKTRKVIIAHEARKTGGIGGEISAIITEEVFDYLDAPVVRVTGPDLPMPFVPSEKDIIQAVESIL
jgi:pyruvate dehydrogenase E1 component beta subunit